MIQGDAPLPEMRPPPDPRAERGLLGPWRMRLFACTAGILVANLYYVQPILADMAASFRHGVTSAGYLVTFTQLGYALGMLLIVPMGDALDRRGLLSALLAANVVGLVAAAASPGFAAFAAASLLVGATSSAAQVIVPFVAAQAPDAMRGRLIGQVMTGLLLGILLARTVSGLIAEWAGWRAVYGIAALVVAALLVTLRAAIPREAPHGTMRYGWLLLSLAQITSAQPELQRRSVYLMLGFGSFSVLWTGLTFLLSGPPYHFTPATIGLFGLIGAAGAIAANAAGRLTDRGHARLMTGSLAGLAMVSWSILALGRHAVAPIILGIFLLDVAVQGLMVTHQSVIYRLVPGAHARITAIFITSGFIGGAIGSALASASFATAGWIGLCGVGAIMPAILLAVWARSPRLPRDGR